MSAVAYQKKLPTSILNHRTDSVVGMLWKMYADQIDEIESVVVSMKDILSIYLMSGVNLDQIGKIVNEPRQGGQEDAVYRLFLTIAIAKKFSSGSLKDLIEIGSSLAVGTGTVFMPVELYAEGEALYLDGSQLLDGLTPLNPTSSVPASIEMKVDGPIDVIEVPLLMADAIDQIRAAGIYAKTRVIFRLLTTHMLLYTYLSDTLDGLGFLDGKSLLSGRKDLNVAEMALGDGATHEPFPGDTGLENEVDRKPVIVRILPNGEREYGMTIFPSELNGIDINELALFGPASIGMIAKDRFEPKTKAGSLVYEFRVEQVLN